MIATVLSNPVPAQADGVKTCRDLRIENGWSRDQYRECRRAEMQQEIDRLDAEFAEMRAWLQARGLDLNDAGHITDPKGRTLAQIEASNAALAASNADLAASNADLAASNAALRADTEALRLRTIAADEEYQQILKDFEKAVLGK